VKYCEKKKPPVSDRDDLRRKIQLMRAAIETMAWPDISGSTDLEVLRAHLDIAHKRGSLTYNASTRQIAEKARIGRVTAGKSRRRLAKFISCVGYNR
jgi:hypothetical protein